MITAYFLHIYTHSHDLSYNFDKELNEIVQLNPDKIICFGESEIESSRLHMRVLFKRIQPWLAKNNKTITILSPVADEAITPNIFNEMNFGYNLILEWTMGPYLAELRESYEDVHLTADRLFTCYNSRPCIERLRMVDTIAKHNLLSQGIVTYNKPDILGKEAWKYHDGSVLYDEENFEMNATGDFTPFKLPKSFLKGFLDIVCESRVQEPEHFMTEKTTKSLLTLKPFIAMATVNYHKFLEDTYGIEPYTELFDYSFDTMTDLDEKIEAIVTNVARLTYLMSDREELNKMHDLLLPKMIRNRDRLLRFNDDKDKMFPKALEFMADGSEYKIYGSQTNPLVLKYAEKKWIADYHHMNFSNVSPHTIYMLTTVNSKNFDVIAEEVKRLKPDTIICDCMSEFEPDFIFKTFFENTSDWLIENNKFVTVLVPSFGPSIKSSYPNVIFESTSGFYTTGVNIIHNIIQNKQDEYKYPSKLFTCYNNNSKTERALLVDQLAKNSLFQHGITTFLHPDKVHDRDFKWQYHDGSILHTGDNFQSNPGNIMEVPNSYDQGFLDIVTESTYGVDEFFVTEKTLKPIGALKPFIALASPGYNTNFLVNEFGFEPYTELFDYSFDTMLDINDRIQGIIDNINRLVDPISMIEYADTYQSLLPKLLRNRKRFLDYELNSDKIIPKSLKPLTDYRVNINLHLTSNSAIINWMEHNKWIIK